MPKKILIPLDGSKLGEAALHYFEELIFALSAEQKVEVTLIQVLTPTPHRMAGKKPYEQLGGWSMHIDGFELHRPSAVWRTLVPASVLGSYVSMLLWIGGFKWADASVASGTRHWQGPHSLPSQISTPWPSAQSHGLPSSAGPPQPAIHSTVIEIGIATPRHWTRHSRRSEGPSRKSPRTGSQMHISG